MPPKVSKRPSVSSAERRSCTVASILSLGEIMPSCSRCAKEGLVCVAIAAPAGRQPSSCAECTRANMRSFCDVRSVSDAEWSRVQSAAAKLDGELSEALAEIRRLQHDDESRLARVRDEERRALEARMNAHARLLRLEKVREKVRSKEWKLVE